MTTAQYKNVILIDGNGDKIFDPNDTQDQIQDLSGNPLTSSQAQALHSELGDRFYFVNAEGKWIAETNSQNPNGIALGYVAGPPPVQGTTRIPAGLKAGGWVALAAGAIWIGTRTLINPDEELTPELTPGVEVVPEEKYFTVYASAEEVDEKKPLDAEAEELLDEADAAVVQENFEEAAEKIATLLQTYDVPIEDAIELSRRAMRLFHLAGNDDRSFEMALLMFEYTIQFSLQQGATLGDLDALVLAAERIAAEYSARFHHHYAVRLRDRLRELGLEIQIPARDTEMGLVSIPEFMASETFSRLPRGVQQFFRDYQRAESDSSFLATIMRRLAAGSYGLMRYDRTSVYESGNHAFTLDLFLMIDVMSKTVGREAAIDYAWTMAGVQAQAGDAVAAKQFLDKASELIAQIKNDRERAALEAAQRSLVQELGIGQTSFN